LSVDKDEIILFFLLINISEGVSSGLRKSRSVFYAAIAAPHFIFYKYKKNIIKSR